MRLLSRSSFSAALLLGLSLVAGAAAPVPALQPFLEQHCLDCHDTTTKKGGLDLETLPLELASPKTLAAWVKVHDRVTSGEMPPKKKARPAAGERDAFTATIAGAIVQAEQARTVTEGRALRRRLNRFEYENTLRDLLGAPWLQVRDALPEDGEAFRFNKVGEALDVSHVQMARYLAVADSALRQVVVSSVERPKPKTVRYYARDSSSFAGKMKFTVFNKSPERATFPLLGTMAQPDVRAGTAPLTVGKKNPEIREQEAMGVVASSYEPIELRFNAFTAPASGRYKLRFSAYSVWVGPGAPERWWRPDLDTVSKGRRNEPVTIYSETPPRLLRRLGAFDVTPDPTVQELDVHLLKGETIRPDAARLFRSRPPAYRNPLAQEDGQPGVAFRWMEVEGPIHEQWPPAGHRLLFGGLPLRPGPAAGAVQVVPKDAAKEAERLLRAFIARAYRRPVGDEEVRRFLPIIEQARKSGSDFVEAMIAGYTAVLCSPEFVSMEEKPGALDDHALAARLSFFLWNSAPDAALRARADRGELRQGDGLREETERLLQDPKAQRFVEAFLDYWLDLRRITATSPDSALYPDYYLDDLLTESAQLETQAFFTELVRGDLPARHLVASDFAMLNERLALHYGLPAVDGVALRRVALPPGGVRGGLLTQAAVLKVTANGTTTSPVVRGAWIMERVLGLPPPPPPPSVPAVEPDTRGATTIREQLDKHRSQESCGACHAKIDPAGFALENFDVLGGWRTRYRAVSEGAEPARGIGHNGQAFTFHDGPVVDATGELPDGRKFRDIRELKALLRQDEKQVARNLARQLTVYATGAPVRFSDRAGIERVLAAAGKDYGVRSLIHAVVQSELFRRK